MKTILLSEITDVGEQGVIQGSTLRGFDGMACCDQTGQNSSPAVDLDALLLSEFEARYGP